MDPAIARRLDELDRTFYERVAAEFSASRTRLNAGIERSLDALAPLGRVLDLGCGDARVGCAWREGRFPGPVDYVGVDRSASLLRARADAAGLALVEADLGESGWVDVLADAIAEFDAGFDVVVCFSMLHHLPGRERRREFLRGLARCLAPRGRWVLSVWQVLHLERFRRRVHAWEEIGLAASDVEPGDLLLDWKRGIDALRYVHEYNEAELREDCSAAGLAVEDATRADGETGDLGLYLRGSRGLEE